MEGTIKDPVFDVDETTQLSDVEAEAVKANVQARKDFEELLSIIVDETIPSVGHPSHEKRLWEYIKEEADKRVASKDKVVPMTDAQAKEYLQSELLRGKYEGKKVKTVIVKDPQWCKKFAYESDVEQHLMKRFLEWMKEAETKAKENL